MLFSWSLLRRVAVSAPPDHRARRRWLIGQLLLLTGSLSGQAVAASQHIGASSATVLDWQRLRALKGHFDGAAWNDEVDRWQGPKHRVMQDLAQGLVQRAARPGDIRQTLGQPDTRLRPGMPGHGLAAASLVRGLGSAEPNLADARRGELWLYRWRGSHDQLVLVLVDGRVRSAGWLQAGE